MCFAVVHFFSADVHFVLQLCHFFGSCTNFLYDYAVVPFFCSCTYYFAVVHLFLQLYNLLPDPILIDFRTTLKHKHMASLVISRYGRAVVIIKVKEAGCLL